VSPGAISDRREGQVARGPSAGVGVEGPTPDLMASSSGSLWQRPETVRSLSWPSRSVMLLGLPRPGVSYPLAIPKNGLGGPWSYSAAFHSTGRDPTSTAVQDQRRSLGFVSPANGHDFQAFLGVVLTPSKS